MSWLERLRDGLSKTRKQINDTAGFLGQDVRDVVTNRLDTIEDLEYALIAADVGRAATEEILDESMTQAQLGRGPLSLLVCDLDNFKAINDQYGHNIGDEVLKATARRMRRSMGNGGHVGRWGGEEFVVVLPGVAKTDALAVAERLRRELAATPLAGLNVTASFGVAAYRPDDTLSALFERADQALYEAKHAGRNLVR